MKQFIHPLLTLALLATGACAPGGGSQPAGTDEVKIARQDARSPITLRGEAIGEIERTVATPEQIAKEASRKRASSILAIPVSPEHNATVYKISGLADDSQYLVSPRVYVYGSNVTSLVRNEKGEVVIPFNIAIIDGLTPKVHMSDLSGTTAEISPELRVRDYSALKNEVSKYAGLSVDQFSIGALPGCPTRISVVTAGRTIDVTPDNMSESDFCELNRPFSVNLKVSESMAQYILTDALRSNMVDVVVNYAVMAPVPVSQMSVKFNKAKIYEQIKMNLQTQYPPYAQADVNLSIEKVLKASRMNIHIQGDYNEQMKYLVQEVAKTFFQPFKADPKAPPTKGCESVVCLTVSYVQQSINEELAIEWTQTENIRMEKVIRIGSKLKPVNDQTTFLGKDASAGASEAQEFTNMNENPLTNPRNVYTVGITPQRGSLVEVTPTKYLYERRKRDSEATIQNRAWDECTGRVGWENKCSYTRRTEVITTMEYTGDSKWVNVPNPLGSVPNLTSGIAAYVRFSNGETVECALEDMISSSQGDRRVIKFENSGLCELFDKNRTTITNFGFINRTKLDDVIYTAGTKVVTNFGRNQDSYKQQRYSPEVRIAAKIRLIGMGFVSISDINN